jgi:DNA mismatch repair ATPase MutS
VRASRAPKITQVLLRSEHPAALVCYQLGNLCALFNDDRPRANRLRDRTLTTRDHGGDLPSRHSALM